MDFVHSTEGAGKMSSNTRLKGGVSECSWELQIMLWLMQNRSGGRWQRNHELMLVVLYIISRLWIAGGE